MNYFKKGTILAAAVLLGAVLTACGDDIVQVNTLDQAITAATPAPEQTTAPAGSGTTVSASSTAAQTTTAAAATTSATTAASAASTAATTAATQAPADNNQQQEQQQTAAPANNNAAPAQTAAPQQATEAPATTAAPQAPAETYLFDAVHVGSDCAAYISSHPGYQFSEALSCVGEGQDRTYTYTNYKLQTLFANGVEELREIEVTGTGIATRKGISVGSSVADVQREYGTPAVPDIYSYGTADGTIDFTVENGTVTGYFIYP